MNEDTQKLNNAKTASKFFWRTIIVIAVVMVCLTIIAGLQQKEATDKGLKEIEPLVLEKY